MIDLNLVIDSPDARTQIGNLFAANKDLPRAASLFEAAVDLDPKNLAALSNLAHVLNDLKQTKLATKWIKQALEIDPNYPYALSNYALISQSGSTKEGFILAQELFEKAIANDPKNCTILNNYAYMLQVLGDYAKALEIYTQARDVNPLDLTVRFHRAMCMITMATTPEEWRAALAEYEIRHLLYNSGMGAPGATRYTGENICEHGQSLMVVAEQGIGDAVMMARYARYLKEEASPFDKIYLYCREAWKPLMERIVGFDGVFSTYDTLPEHRFFIPAMSLLMAEDYPAKQPTSLPYLHARSVIPREAGKIRIGLCWQGNAEHGNDKYRSIGPDVFCDPFAGLARLDGDVEFYSLHQPEVSKLRPEFVKDVSVNSLDRLADVIQSMDLIVTVDTAILHIAGAEWVPVFGLLPSNPDFRWHVSGENTQWYPSVRLFRATEPLQWGPVMKRVTEEVKQFISKKRNQHEKP